MLKPGEVIQTSAPADSGGTYEPFQDRTLLQVSAWHKAVLRFASPARVIPPVTSRSPDWWRQGVRPTQGPTFFGEEKRAGSLTADRKVRATTAPTPGMVMSRQQTGSFLASSLTLRSSAANS